VSLSYVKYNLSGVIIFTSLNAYLMNLQSYRCHIVVILTTLLFTLTTAIASPAYAFTQSNFDTLQSTKKCPGCDLSGIVLLGADLSGATLRDANLSGADLSNATLTNASLARANLSNANLRGAKLDGAKLGLANLTNAQLEGASLDGALFYGTVMPDGSIRNE
jgi:uncharacterized protein YjbI with pentapeptide repeats